MSSLKPCGTVAAHRRHARRGEKPCDACKKAWADEHRAYIARADEAVLAKKRIYDKAYRKALSRLAAAHRVELSALVAEEVDRATP